MTSDVGKRFYNRMVAGFKYTLNLNDESGYGLNWVNENERLFTHFLKNDTLMNVLKAQLIMKKYLAYKSREFSDRFSRRSHESRDWNNFERVEMGLTVTTTMRFIPANKKIENNLEALLIMAANKVFIFPHWFTSYKLNKIDKIDLSVFDLTEDERTIINGISSAGLTIEARKLLMGGSDLMIDLYANGHFRHALVTKYIQVSNSSKRNYNNEKFDAHILSTPFEVQPPSSEKEALRKMKRTNEIIGEIRKIFLMNEVENKDHVLIFNGFELKVIPHINTLAHSRITNYLKSQCDVSLLEVKHFRFFIPKDENQVAQVLEENKAEAPSRKYYPPPPPRMERDQGIRASEIIDFPDVEPSFPGGAEALRKFILENINYPISERNKGHQGKVYLSFEIEKDGSIANIKVMKGINPVLDKEAIRVIEKMPKWTPGESDGRKAMIKVSLPIVFKLD